MCYLDVLADQGATLAHPDSSQEAAICIISGAITIDGEHFTTGDFVLLDADD
jgi:redox-sensitive bicupin YhaK (pirin superfamily)